MGINIQFGGAPRRRRRRRKATLASVLIAVALAIAAVVGKLMKDGKVSAPKSVPEVRR